MCFYIGYSSRSREVGQFATIHALEAMALAVDKGRQQMKSADELCKHKKGNKNFISADETWSKSIYRSNKVIHRTGTGHTPSASETKSSSTRTHASSQMYAAGYQIPYTDGEVKFIYPHPGVVFNGARDGHLNNQAKEDKTQFVRYNKSHYFTTEVILEWLDWFLYVELAIDPENDTVFLWWDAGMFIFQSYTLYLRMLYIFISYVLLYILKYIHLWA